MTDHLTGNYRFAEHRNLRPGLVLEVQKIINGSTCETEWRRADYEDLKILVAQISDDTQEVVTITNLRYPNVTRGRAAKEPSYSAYAIKERERKPDAEDYDTWVRHGKRLHMAYGGSARGLWLWHAACEGQPNYDKAALDAKWVAFGDSPALPVFPAVSFWNHDPFVPYIFGNWQDNAGEADVIANGSPGDMYIRRISNHGGAFEVYIHGERGFAQLILGNVKDSIASYATLETAKAAAMATHAMMSGNGDF